MSDYIYNTQVTEIEGEIASLKITLKNTTDLIRAREIEEEIKQLEEQLKKLKEKIRKRDNDFRNRYKVDNIETSDGNDEIEEHYLGPTGPIDHLEEDIEI